MPNVHLGTVEELEQARKKVFAVGDREIGVFFLAGQFYAWHNECPHQGGPVCQGRMFRLVEEVVDDEKNSDGRRYHDDAVNIVCPWHGAEYDIRTGRHPGNPTLALTPAKVYVRDGKVYVDV